MSILFIGLTERIRAATFLFRQPRPGCDSHRGDCCFAVPDFAGLDGTNDIGKTWMSDDDVRAFVRLERSAA